MILDEYPIPQYAAFSALNAFELFPTEYPQLFTRKLFNGCFMLQDRYFHASQIFHSSSFLKGTNSMLFYNKKI